jgi:hypothetical protein
MIEVNEIVYRWHRGEPKAAIARSLGADRKTVRKFIRLAEKAGLRHGAPLPEPHELALLLAPLR